MEDDMTEKLIPVQLPLRPEKAYLYRTRNGGHIRAINNFDGIRYILEVHHHDGNRYHHDDYGRLYGFDHNERDITHEVVEENEEKPSWLKKQMDNHTANPSSMPEWMERTSGANAALNSPYNKCSGCVDDLDSLVKTIISYIDGNLQDDHLSAYVKKNYPEQWEKYSDECNQEPELHIGGTYRFRDADSEQIGILIAYRPDATRSSREAVFELGVALPYYSIVKTSAIIQYLGE